MTQAYPLQWPDGWPRAKNRENGRTRFASGTGLERRPVSMSKARDAG